MEQLSFIIDTLEESIKKQMLKAINKGIIPGAIVIFDGVKQDRNIVIALSLGNENKIEARLMSEDKKSFLSYPALSDRLTVVDFYNKK